MLSPGAQSDLISHFSAVAAQGFKSLAEGDQVEFEVTRGLEADGQPTRAEPAGGEALGRLH